MVNAKDKAVEMFGRYNTKVEIITTMNSIPERIYDNISFGSAKQFTAMAVEEILNEPNVFCDRAKYEYYKQVRNEISLLKP